MGKSLLGALGALGTASVAAPTTFLTSNGERFIVQKINQPKRKTWKGTKIPELTKSSDIKSKYKDIDCLSEYYGTGGAWGASTKTKEQKQQLIGSSDISKSCLIVEYYKQEHKGKWKGGFRLIWSASGENKGLVASFDAYTGYGNLILEYSLYFLEKENNSWFLTYEEEDNNEDIYGNNILSTFFPKPGSPLKSQTTGDYWGFNPDIEKICLENECQEEVFKQSPSTQSFRWNWNANSGGGKISDWCENIEDLFAGSSANETWEKVKTELEKIKGTWTKA